MKNVASNIGIGLLLVVGGLAGTDASAQADRLSMGVFPGVESGAESAEILDRYMPLADYLSGKIGAKVLVLPVKLPGMAMERMIKGAASYKLFFGPSVFASEAIQKADFLPIVVEEERIRAVFVVKTESKLQKLGDFVDTTRVAMPRPKLLLAILASETLSQQKITLKERKHMASNDIMLLALDNGLADVVVLRDRAAKKLMADKPSKYRVVGQTVDAPGFALIAHKSVPDAMRGKIRQVVLALNKDDSPLAKDVRAGLMTSPFVAGKDDEFAALQRMMAAWAP